MIEPTRILAIRHGQTAWNADSRAQVDTFHTLLVRQGARILDGPAEFPQHGEGYYAVFFEDPDGIKLELAFTP